MKKLFLLTLIATLSVPTLASAEDTDMEMCTQATQVAVDRYGNCQVFATSCDVPDNWTKKPVESCDEIEKARDQARYDRIAERRRQGYNRYLQSKKEEVDANQEDRRVSGGSRFGKAGVTSSALRTRGTTETDYSKRRTYSRRSITPSAISQYRYYSGKSTDSDLHKTQYGQQRPAIRSSAYGANREGTLKNEPNVYQRQEDHFRSTNYGTRSPYWKSYQQMRSEKKEANKTEYIPRTVRLRKTYRGLLEDRRNADLSDNYVKPTPIDLLPGYEEESRDNTENE